ncbi:MAG: hypothetical protein Q9202_003378 [Teloschistes flavicans]
MFTWYQNAKQCYAYMSDFSFGEGRVFDKTAFQRSRWFRRVWTLQELLAPSEVVFFDRHWQYIGEKSKLTEEISSATGIDAWFVRDSTLLPSASIATQMSWASHRQTTRLEDEAYCLMGLFDVNMPLLYGEGRKAFRRLQHEIAGSIDDESLFAWQEPILESGLFALSPRSFATSRGIPTPPSSSRSREKDPFTITNRGVRFETLCMPVPSELAASLPIDLQSSMNSKEYLLCPINCALPDSLTSIIILLKREKNSGVVTRFLPGIHIAFSSQDGSWDQLRARTFYITDPARHLSGHLLRPRYAYSTAIKIPDKMHIWYVTSPGYATSNLEGNRMLYFTTAPALAVVAFDDSKEPQPALILEHVLLEDDTYDITLQCLDGRATIMECITACRQSSQAREGSSPYIDLFPELVARNFSGRKLDKGMSRHSKLAKSYGFRIYHGGGDDWALEPVASK